MAGAKNAPAKKTTVKTPVAANVPERAVVGNAPASKSSMEIREWAIGAGHEVSPRGRIPAEIQQAFHEAQANQVQAQAVPVKKTAAKKTAGKKAAAKKTAVTVRVKPATTSTVPTTKTATKKTAATKTAATKTAATKTAGEKSAEKKRIAEKSTVKKIVAAKVPVTRAAVRKAPAGKSSREIREWAIGAGHEVSSRGRIPGDIERAFRDAQVEMPVA
jgi:hypothetical protein